jgi:hypothetical protein
MLSKILLVGVWFKQPNEMDDFLSCCGPIFCVLSIDDVAEWAKGCHFMSFEEMFYVCDKSPLMPRFNLLFFPCEITCGSFLIHLEGFMEFFSFILLKGGSLWGLPHCCLALFDSWVWLPWPTDLLPDCVVLEYGGILRLWIFFPLVFIFLYMPCRMALFCYYLRVS